MQQMLAASNAMGPGAGAAGGWGGFGGGFGGAGYGMGSPPVPSDTRSPEERFQVQLQVSRLFIFSFPLFPWFLTLVLLFF